jgi:hypothetical protein
MNPANDLGVPEKVELSDTVESTMNDNDKAIMKSTRRAHPKATTGNCWPHLVTLLLSDPTWCG